MPSSPAVVSVVPVSATASSSAPATAAERVIDGIGATYWCSAGKAQVGEWVEVKLAQARRVRGVTVGTTTRTPTSPSAIRVSFDGGHAKVAPVKDGKLELTGLDVTATTVRFAIDAIEGWPKGSVPNPRHRTCLHTVTVLAEAPGAMRISGALRFAPASLAATMAQARKSAAEALAFLRSAGANINGLDPKQIKNVSVLGLQKNLDPDADLEAVVEVFLNYDGASCSTADPDDRRPGLEAADYLVWFDLVGGVYAPVGAVRAIERCQHATEPMLEAEGGKPSDSVFQNVTHRAWCDVVWPAGRSWGVIRSHDLQGWSMARGAAELIFSEADIAEPLRTVKLVGPTPRALEIHDSEASPKLRRLPFDARTWRYPAR